MICPSGKVENLFERGWTDGIKLKGFEKFDFWRKRTDILISRATTEGQNLPFNYRLARSKDCTVEPLTLRG